MHLQPSALSSWGPCAHRRRVWQFLVRALSHTTWQLAMQQWLYHVHVRLTDCTSGAQARPGSPMGHWPVPQSFCKSARNEHASPVQKPACELQHRLRRCLSMLRQETCPDCVTHNVTPQGQGEAALRIKLHKLTAVLGLGSHAGWVSHCADEHAGGPGGTQTAAWLRGEHSCKAWP